MIYLLFLPVFLFLGIKATLSLDPDFGWHLFLGQKMSETHTLITKAVGYNYFENLPIPDHEWLSDLIMYQLYDKLGYWSLALITLFICLILGLLLIRLIEINAQLITSRIIVQSIVITSLIFTFNGVRIQYLLFLASVIFLLVKSVIKSFKIRLLLYFILVTIGNNLHGGLLTLLLIPLLLEFDFSLLKKDFRKIIIRLFILSITLILALMINPNNLHYWQLINSYATSSYYLSNIEEWLPIFSFPVNIFYLIVLSLIIFFLTINSYFKKIQKNELLLICIYLFLGTVFSRYFPIAIIIVSPSLARAIDDFFVSTKITKKNQFLFVFISLCFTTSAIVLDFPTDRTAWLKPFSDKHYPKKAVESMVKNKFCQDLGNFLNPYDWGGYLIWTNQKQKIFIDGRGPQTIASGSTKKSILEIRDNFESPDPQIVQKNILEHDISCVLVDTRHRSIGKSDFLNRWILKQYKLTEKDLNRNYLLYYLSNSSDWQEIYSDEVSSLFQKTNP